MLIRLLTSKLHLYLRLYVYCHSCCHLTLSTALSDLLANCCGFLWHAAKRRSSSTDTFLDFGAQMAKYKEERASSTGRITQPEMPPPIIFNHLFILSTCIKSSNWKDSIKLHLPWKNYAFRKFQWLAWRIYRDDRWDSALGFPVWFLSQYLVADIDKGWLH